MTKALRVLSPTLAALLLAACQSLPLEPSGNYVPDKVVSSDYALFFRLGPQQPGGADLSLRTNEKVMLLRKEFGYSRVQLEDGQVGYMANEDLQPAPPPPPGKNRGHLSGKNKKGERQATEADESYADDIPPLDPNLGIRPDDVPLEPLPDLLPEPVDVPKIIPPPAPTPPPPVKETLPEKHEPEPEPAAPISTST